MISEYPQTLKQELEYELVEATDMLNEIEQSAWHVVTNLRSLRSSLMDIEEMREHIERMKKNVL